MRGIIGTETITVVRKVLTGTNDVYGNPQYIETSFVVNNVLSSPGNNSITVEPDGWENQEVITFYVNPNVEVHKSDNIVYNGNIYHISNPPIKWVPQKGSPIKPKLVIVAQLTQVGEF